MAHMTMSTSSRVMLNRVISGWVIGVPRALHHLEEWDLGAPATHHVTVPDDRGAEVPLPLIEFGDEQLVAQSLVAP